MIKVTFKEPQQIYRDNESIECLHLFGMAIKHTSDYIIVRLSKISNDVYAFKNTNNIKSIEHVKPTDL